MRQEPLEIRAILGGESTESLCLSQGEPVRIRPSARLADYLPACLIQASRILYQPFGQLQGLTATTRTPRH
jgi:hypothetical protein